MHASQQICYIVEKFRQVNDETRLRVHQHLSPSFCEQTDQRQKKKSSFRFTLLHFVILTSLKGQLSKDLFLFQFIPSRNHSRSHSNQLSQWEYFKSAPSPKIDRIRFSFFVSAVAIWWPLQLSYPQQQICHRYPNHLGKKSISREKFSARTRH